MSRAISSWVKALPQFLHPMVILIIGILACFPDVRRTIDTIYDGKALGGTQPATHASPD